MSRSKIAFVMGKQGSGKTTRICARIRRELWRLRLASFMQLRLGCIAVHANRFNHLAIDEEGGVVLVTGLADGRVPVKLHTFRGWHVIELPHSGYIPENIVHSLAAGILARIFLIELPEATWRAIGGETGAITSVSYFQLHGRLVVSRSQCNYAADTARIRSDIARSGLPSFRYSDATTLVRDLLVRG